MQFARQTARRADDYVALLARTHESAKHFRVGRRGRVVRRGILGGRRLPFGLGLVGGVAPGARRLPGVERRIERGERRAGVADDGQRAMLDCIERLHVEADEPPIGILKQRPGPGGEVGKSRPDADDHVRLRSERVGRAGPGDSDRPHGQGMVDRSRGLAGLRLADRNAASGAKVDQFALRIRIKDAAAADHQRPLGLF